MLKKMLLFIAISSSFLPIFGEENEQKTAQSATITPEQQLAEVILLHNNTLLQHEKIIIAHNNALLKIVEFNQQNLWYVFIMSVTASAAVCALHSMIR